MVRKRVRIARIVNESARKARLRKRMAGLFKKAEELCVLCDVQIGIAIYSPDEAAAAPGVWPSREEMEGLMMKFFGMPESERARKSSTLESYLKERIEKEEVKMNKAKKKNDEKEMEQIMWELVEGINNVDVNGLVDVKQLHGLSLLAADMRDKFRKRQNQEPPPPPPPPLVSPARVDEAAATRDVRALSIPTSMEPLMNDQWFMDTMTQHQYMDHTGGPSSSGGNDLGQPPEYAAGGTSGTKDKELLPDDLNSAWPHIYSP